MSFIKLGSFGREVFELQKDLIALGYKIKADADFGPQTEAALKDFQKRYGLEVDGIAGPISQKRIDDLIVSHASSSNINKKPIPTRDEMLTVVRQLISGEILPRVGVGYGDIRETNGKNRSPALDVLIQRQGGALGDPYCQCGQQEILDELCIHYGVERGKINIPEGASTQTVFESTPKDFVYAKPFPMRWVTWRKGNTWRGHIGLVVGSVQNGIFETFEFNTGPGKNIVRDGEGCYYKERDLDGYGDMNIRGYIDIYEAIVKAMQTQNVQAEIG